MKITKQDVLGFIVTIILISGIMYLTFSPVIKILDECEAKEWDGSEYNTKVSNMALGENFGKEIIVKCNKDKEGETDVIISIANALHISKGSGNK